MALYFVNYTYQNCENEIINASMVVKSKLIKKEEDYDELRDVVANYVRLDREGTRHSILQSIKNFRCLDIDYLLYDFLKSKKSK